MGLASVPSRRLLATYVQVLDELRRRGLVRSTNNPVADIAELLVVTALRLELSHRSARGYDATDRKGRRYQIKGRRVTAHNKSRQLSFVRGLNEAQKPFDYLAGVLFNEDFSVMRGCIIPVNLVPSISTYRKRENAWRLLLQDALWQRKDVRDITRILKVTESKVITTA